MPCQVKIRSSSSNISSSSSSNSNNSKTKLNNRSINMRKTDLYRLSMKILPCISTNSNNIIINSNNKCIPVLIKSTYISNNNPSNILTLIINK